MDFKTRLAKVTDRNTVKKRVADAPYNLDEKIEVVSKWLVLGNLREVAAIMNLKYDTVRKWHGEPWWLEVEKEIRASQNIQMDNRLSEIVDKSLIAVHDRLVNGDYFYDQKTGEIKRKPVQLKDAHKVAADLLQRMEVMRDGQKNRQEGTQVSVEEHLKMLANQMAQWFEPKKETIIVDEDIEDAIPKEREEGLQEGTPVGAHEETESSPRPSGAEQSSLDTGSGREGTQG